MMSCVRYFFVVFQQKTVQIGISTIERLNMVIGIESSELDRHKENVAMEEK